MIDTGAGAVRAAAASEKPISQMLGMQIPCVVSGVVGLAASRLVIAMSDTVQACPYCDDGGLQTFPRDNEYYCRECKTSFPMDEAVEREKRGHGRGGVHSGGVKALLDADPSIIGGD